MSIQNRRPRRRSLLQLVLLAALPATFLALSAAPSGAVTITSISPSTTVASGTTLTVAGSQGANEHYYFVAVCGQSTPLGSDCDAGSAVGPVFPSGGTWHAGPTATKLFTNTSFIPGVSPTAPSTTCKSSSGDMTAGRVQCYVVVSAYNTSGTQIGATSQAIWIT